MVTMMRDIKSVFLKDIGAGFGEVTGVGRGKSLATATKTRLENIPPFVCLDKRPDGYVGSALKNPRDAKSLLMSAQRFGEVEVEIEAFTPEAQAEIMIACSSNFLNETPPSIFNIIESNSEPPFNFTGGKIDIDRAKRILEEFIWGRAFSNTITLKPGNLPGLQRPELLEKPPIPGKLPGLKSPYELLEIPPMPEKLPNLKSPHKLLEKPSSKNRHPFEFEDHGCKYRYKEPPNMIYPKVEKLPRFIYPKIGGREDKINKNDWFEFLDYIGILNESFDIPSEFLPSKAREGRKYTRPGLMDTVPNSQSQKNSDGLKAEQAGTDAAEKSDAAKAFKRFLGDILKKLGIK